MSRVKCVDSGYCSCIVRSIDQVKHRDSDTSWNVPNIPVIEEGSLKFVCIITVDVNVSLADVTTDWDRLEYLIGLFFSFEFGIVCTDLHVEIHCGSVPEIDLQLAGVVEGHAHTSVAVCQCRWRS